MRWMDKLKQAEFQYQIEKARRIAKNQKKASYKEAAKRKEIRYCIGQCKAIERIYNREAEITLSLFGDTVHSETGFEVTREILDSEEISRNAMREYNTACQKTRRYVKRNASQRSIQRSEIAEDISIPQSSSEIEEMRREIIERAKEYGATKGMKDLFPTSFDTEAPEKRDFSGFVIKTEGEKKNE